MPVRPRGCYAVGRTGTIVPGIPLTGPADRRPVPSTHVTNFDEWLEAVAANRGVGVVPISAAYRVVHPAIRFVLLEGAPPVSVFLAFPRQGGHPFTRQFVSAAQHVAIPPHTSPPPVRSSA